MVFASLGVKAGDANVNMNANKKESMCFKC